ncbi:MAG: fimbria/pilus periplasmic chaperone [Gammaproteobacteria bacterium]|jgi:P pilus assembly chaperone PapD
MLQRLVLSALATLIWNTPALADLVVDRTVIRFDTDTPARQDIEITNTEKDALYLAMDVYEVEDPGTDAEAQLRPKDPNAVTLLVTPDKMILSPGSRKLLRLVNLGGSGDKERIFRVKVRPVGREIESSTDAVTIVGYEILVIVRPRNPHPILRHERQGRRITFINDGNTNVLLHSGEQCPAEGAARKGCATLIPKRLYAGNRWELTLPYDAPVEYSITIGDDDMRRRFK